MLDQAGKREHFKPIKMFQILNIFLTIQFLPKYRVDVSTVKPKKSLGMTLNVFFISCGGYAGST